MNSPVKYHGGKHYLADKIVAMMPPHIHYVEPFAGGLSVLLARPLGKSEVVNDLDGNLTNFWETLRNPTGFAAFQRALTFTPFSEVEFLHASDDEAFGFFIRCRQSLAGRMKCFAPLSRNRTRRGMNEQAAAWLSAIDGLPEVHERLRGVVIYNKPAIEVIRQQDGPGTLFYCDPPYLDETRASPKVYAHEMSASDHIELLRTLGNIQGKFLLSGYPSLLYDSMGWSHTDFDLPNNSAGGESKRRMIERVWRNF